MKQRKLRYKNFCIDCETILTEGNTENFNQRRCNFCVKEAESYRKEKGKKIVKKLRKRKKILSSCKTGT